MSNPARETSRPLAVLMISAVLGACASGTVVLLPQQDGKEAAVSVKQGDKEVVLDQPYAATKTTALGPRTYQSNAGEVTAQFGSALGAQPSRPATFTLYFVEGKDELTDESKRVVDTIMAEIAKRSVPDVLVVGHTDTVGNDQFNDALGQQRAETVRASLIRLGIPAEDIRAISRGKRALAVQTGEGVPESRNRRVEIVVR